MRSLRIPIIGALVLGAAAYAGTAAAKLGSCNDPILLGTTISETGPFSTLADKWRKLTEVFAEEGVGSWNYALSYDSSGRLASISDDYGDVGTWTYDDDAGTISSDWNNGGWTAVTTYDAQGRYLSDEWGGSDPSAIVGSDVYAWNGDQVLSAIYSSGSEDAPKTVQLIETDTLRYDCAMARANSGHTMRMPKATLRR